MEYIFSTFYYFISIFLNFIDIIKGMIDQTDRNLLAALAENSRTPVAVLARKVGLTAPTVAERIRRMEDAGIIRGYSLAVDPVALGQHIKAWVRIRPTPGRYDKVVEIIRDTAEIVRCDRVTGDDCFVALAYVPSVAHLEQVIDRLVPFAVTNTSIIQSSTVEPRLPPLTTPA